MRCPRCGHIEDRVVDSRVGRDGHAIRRRRECLECEHRFTTYERVELSLPLIVKRDGRREAWDRDKPLRALHVACQKRSVSIEALNQVVDRLERELASMGEREVGSIAVGELLIAELRQLDDVAYLRFASVYHSFDTINEFLAEAARVRRDRLDEDGEGEPPEAA